MAKAKNISGIDCDAAVAMGIHLVLTARIEEMCSLREKALDWSDPEGVHDMRVASRRLRSALRDFMPHLRKPSLTSSLRQTKTIADALGGVRDQDVAIIALEKIATKAPAEVSQVLAKFVEVRRVRRDQARKRLMQALQPRRIAKLQTEFATALVNALRPPVSRKKRRRGPHPAGAPTYRQVASAIILGSLGELEELSDSLYHPLRIKPLHRMRIAAKRLRYAIELFEQCWGPEVSMFARKVSRLQSSLGELHDCDLWIENFGGDLSKAKKKNGKKEASLEDSQETASVWLLNHFVKLRTKHFRNALARWREWEANKFSQQLRQTVQVDSSLPPITTSDSSIAASETTGFASTQDN